MAENATQKDGVSAIPVEFAGDPVRWATWLYFVERQTQNEVAGELGVSRATVANYLTEAREKGLVAINVAPDILANVEIGQQVAAKYGLDGAHVVPLPEDSANPQELLRSRLGSAGANVLLHQLSAGDVLGVAWGRTMLALGQSLPRRTITGCQVVQIAGSSVDGDDAAPEYCTALIADRLGARCRNFPAPAVVSDPALRDALLQEPALKSQFDLIRACTTLIFGVSELDAATRFADPWFMSGKITEEYLNLGASAVALGRFIAPDGGEVDGPLAGRMVGMAPKDVKKVPRRILVAGGGGKTEAIIAAINGEYATQLVTDIQTARNLL